MPTASPGTRLATNAEIAQVLERVAALLEAQQADGYRLRAYRTAAATCRRWDAELADLVQAGGRAALEALPGIGASSRLGPAASAAALASIASTGVNVSISKSREHTPIRHRRPWPRW